MGKLTPKLNKRIFLGKILANYMVLCFCVHFSLPKNGFSILQSSITFLQCGAMGSELTLKECFGIGFQADDGFICMGTQGRWYNRHPPLLPEM